MALVGALRTCGAPAPLTLGVRLKLRLSDSTYLENVDQTSLQGRMKMLSSFISRIIQDKKIAKELAQAKGYMLARNRNNPEAVEYGWLFYLELAPHKYKITKEDVDRINNKIDNRVVEATQRMVMDNMAASLEHDKRISTKEYQLYRQKFQALDYNLTCISPENAHPLHKEGTPIFKKALIDLINAWADTINAIPRRGGFDEFSKIDTIELICIPRFAQFELEISYKDLKPKNDTGTEYDWQTISLRECDIEQRTGRKMKVPARDLAAKHMELAEQRMDLPCRGLGDLTHILLIAAADALLSEEVIEKLISCGVRATSHPAHREKSIDFILKDFHSATNSMNYCDFISAQKSYIYFSPPAEKTLS